MAHLFPDIPPIRFEGSSSSTALAFRTYDAEEEVLGKSLADHLCFATALSHPYTRGEIPNGLSARAKQKADIAFRLFETLGLRYFCFEEDDVRPLGESTLENVQRFEERIAYLANLSQSSGIRVLHGKASLRHGQYFSTETIAQRTASLCGFMDALHMLNAKAMVLSHARPVYAPPPPTPRKQERAQATQILQDLVEHRSRTGFSGALLIEPIPQEPTKGQYDFDVITVSDFLTNLGLADEVGVHLDHGQATIAGHRMADEVARARARDLLVSIGMNRANGRPGRETEQFVDTADECAQVFRAQFYVGEPAYRGTSFDPKLHQHPMPAETLLLTHVKAMDACAAGFKAAVSTLPRSFEVAQ